MLDGQDGGDEVTHGLRALRSMGNELSVPAMVVVVREKAGSMPHHLQSTASFALRLFSKAYLTVTRSGPGHPHKRFHTHDSIVDDVPARPPL